MTAKVALITGAAQRIGRALTVHLATQGYDIAIHYNNSRQEAEECQRLVQSSGGVRRAMVIQANLDDSKQVTKLIPTVNAELGEISLLLNNAAVFNSEKFLDTTREQFEHDFAINFKAPFFLAQNFARQVSSSNPGEAMIVNLGDSAHERITSNYFLYRLSKQALHHFTLLAAKELAPLIRVNAIAPGPALPPPDKDESYLKNVASKTPLGIASPPNSLVQGLDYLLTAHTVTGQVLYIDSGMHLSHS